MIKPVVTFDGKTISVINVIHRCLKLSLLRQKEKKTDTVTLFKIKIIMRVNYFHVIQITLEKSQQQTHREREEEREETEHYFNDIQYPVMLLFCLTAILLCDKKFRSSQHKIHDRMREIVRISSFSLSIQMLKSHSICVRIYLSPYFTSFYPFHSRLNFNIKSQLFHQLNDSQNETIKYGKRRDKWLTTFWSLKTDSKI